VGEAVDISWCEDEAAAELEGILAEFVLVVAGCAGAFAAGGVIAAKEMKQIGGAQVGDGVGLALVVDEQGERDAGLLAENAGVVAVAEADGGEGSAFVAEGWLVLAQLRDVLAAKDSTVVAEKDDDGGLGLPQ
jgi:hypothetical protein